MKHKGITVNCYYAFSEEVKGDRTAMYGGYAQSEERFIEMCEEAEFDLEGLEVELDSQNVKDEMGKPFPEKVWKDFEIFGKP